jgi:MFS family permease
LGIFYLWGNIAPYVTSYLFHHNGDAGITKYQTNIMFPLQAVFQVIANPIGAVIQKKINNKLVVLIGATICIIGIFVSSFTTSLAIFILFYACIFGLGIGTSYFAPLVCGWEWHPG